MKKWVLVLISVSFLFLIGACGRSRLDSSIDAPKEVEPTRDCPAAVDGAQPLVNEAHGYCLVYPAGYTVYHPSGNEVSIVVGSLMNHVEPRASIEVSEAAGRTVVQAADELIAEFNQGVGFDIKRSGAMVGGEEAIVLDNMPGQDLHRRVVVIHDGLLYWLQFTPIGVDYGEAGKRTEVLYATVIESLRFLPGGGVSQNDEVEESQ